jgi:hypothetical protein
LDFFAGFLEAFFVISEERFDHGELFVGHQQHVVDQPKIAPQEIRFGAPAGQSAKHPTRATVAAVATHFAALHATEGSGFALTLGATAAFGPASTLPTLPAFSALTTESGAIASGFLLSEGGGRKKGRTGQKKSGTKMGSHGGFLEKASGKIPNQSSYETPP